MHATPVFHLMNRFFKTIISLLIVCFALTGEAKTIREQYKDFLPNTVLREINKSIEVCENSKEAKIKDCLNKALEHAKKEIFVYAWTEYNKAVELQGEEIEKIKKIIISSLFIKKF